MALRYDTSAPSRSPLSSRSRPRLKYSCVVRVLDDRGKFWSYKGRSRAKGRKDGGMFFCICGCGCFTIFIDCCGSCLAGTTVAAAFAFAEFACVKSGISPPRSSLLRVAITWCCDDAGCCTSTTAPISPISSPPVEGAPRRRVRALRRVRRRRVRARRRVRRPCSLSALFLPLLPHR